MLEGASCKTCQKKHNSFLHFEPKVVAPVPSNSNEEAETTDQELSPGTLINASRVCIVAANNNKFILLPTAVARYRNRNSRSFACPAGYRLAD